MHGKYGCRLLVPMFYAAAMELSGMPRPKNTPTGEFALLSGSDAARIGLILLPRLVRQANVGEPITYGALGQEIGKFHRQLPPALYIIGNDLLTLNENLGLETPPIEALVVNKGTGLPGSGFMEAFSSHAGKWLGTIEQYEARPDEDNRRLLALLHEDIRKFGQWDRVLAEFGLEPLPAPAEAAGAAYTRVVSGAFAPGGEQEAHRRLKDYIADHPRVVGVPTEGLPPEAEHAFPSQDKCDVLFRRGHCWYIVEVKPSGAPEEDVLRGLFQCVKYQALAEAEQKVSKAPEHSVRTVLALGGKLPGALLPMRAVLGIEVIEDIQAKADEKD